MHIANTSWATGWTTGVQGFNYGIFSLRHCVRTGSGAHAASYPMDAGGCSFGGKAAGPWSRPLTV